MDRLIPCGRWVCPAGHNGVAVLGCDFSYFLPQEFELLERISDIGMDIRADFELRLQEFTAGLPACRPVHRFKKLVRCLHGRLERSGVRNEVFLLNTEREVLLACGSPFVGPNDDMLTIVAQAHFQSFEDCRVKSHGPASSSPAARLAKVANAPWGSVLVQAAPAFARHTTFGTALVILPRTDLELRAPVQETDRAGNAAQAPGNIPSVCR